MKQLDPFGLLDQPQSADEKLWKNLCDEISGVSGAEQFLTPTDPVGWIEEHFRIPETTDHRIRLSAYQKFALQRALALREDGKYRYSIILWSDIKKSAKSVLAGAVALYTAFTKPWASVKMLGNDLKQADSRSMEYARRCIELNPEMRQVARVKPSGYLISLPNHSRIEAIPIDPSGEAGANDDAIFYSELWGAKSKASLKMWAEMAISPTKFGYSFIWCESYAGESGESPLLEQLYETGVKHGAQVPGAEQFDPPLEIFENPNAGLLALWNTTPRLAWQTPAYYASEASRLTDNEFRRLHQNAWVSSTDAFVPIEWWDGCRKLQLPPMVHDDPMVLGVDAAIEGDCFAIVGITGFQNDIYCVRFSRCWYPAKGQKIHFRTEEEDGPEDELRRLIDRYNVIEIAYDPYQMADLAERFTGELLANMTAFGQGTPRLVADKQLHDVIRNRGIMHSGDPDLREHIANANRKSEGEKLRIVKRSEHMKIDLAVALSMAVDRARSWGI